MKRRIIILLCVVSVSLTCMAQNPYVVNTTGSKAATTASRLNSGNSGLAEESFIKRNFPFVHMSDWYKGMKFMVQGRGEGIDVLERMSLFAGVKDRFGAMGLDLREVEHQTFTVVDAIERYIGNEVALYIVFENERGVKYCYEYLGSRERMRASDDLNCEIRGLIYLRDIDVARQRLINRQVYIMTRDWFQEGSDGPVRIKGRKYVPVTITKIGIGNHNAPYKIVFRTIDNYEFYVNVRLSETNNYDRLVSKNFYEVFSFTDVRKDFSISAKVWEKIESGEVTEGMTREECRLSWGEPRNVMTSGSAERWLYEGGNELYFENGLLQSAL